MWSRRHWLSAAFVFLGLLLQGCGDTANLLPPAAAVGEPGAVTDLAVTAAGRDWVELRFTERDDGTGQPADYDLRFATGTIQWDSALGVSQGTCSTPVEGNAVGVARLCRAEGLDACRDHELQLKAFRGNVNQGAVYGPLSNVARGKSEPPPLPPPDAQEFALTERGFSAVDEDGWDHQGGQVIITDASPRSPPDVIRYTYQAGHPAGSGAGKNWKMWWRDFGNSGFPEIEFEIWMKLSTNWYGQTANSKLFYVKTDDSGWPLFFAAVGAGSNPMHLEARVQAGNARNLLPNVCEAEIVRGEWFQILARLKMNTGSNSDGELHVWFNGSKSHEYTDVKFVSPENNPNQWGGLEINGVWGGTKGTVPETQYLWVDHVVARGWRQ